MVDELGERIAAELVEHRVGQDPRHHRLSDHARRGHDAGVAALEGRGARLLQFDAKAASGRTVVAHLGNGSSMCAMVGGRSVASTMGFTAVDGLPMGTRCGNLDPGVILYLMDELGMDARAIEDLVYKQSGLLGVSGISSDMRALLASDDERARFAVELFTYRGGRELGSLAAAAGGIDALVFTAGIGEHAPAIRERICRDAAWLGVELDPAANQAGGPRISAAGSRVSAWVIPTNEEVMIARHTSRVAGRLVTRRPKREMAAKCDHVEPDRQPRSLDVSMEITNPILKGAKVLVCGIANEHSIAYGCAKAFHEFGADLAITYLDEKVQEVCRAARTPAGGAALPAARRRPAGRSSRRSSRRSTSSGASSTSWCTRSPGRPRTICRAAC